MSDFERDPGVRNLLMTAGDEATRFVRPDGVGAVVSTVRHRRRTRAVAVAALALVLAGGSATAVALAGVPGTTVPPGGPPSASASTSPSAVPSPSASSGPPAPDGRISLADLRNATIDIPAWPTGFDDSCPTGAVKFTGGAAGPGDLFHGLVQLQGTPVYADVDHDGAQETVILVSCSPQGSDYKVLALDRDVHGAIVTLGQVVGSAGNTGHEGTDIMTIWGIAAGDNGQVRVDVGEYRPCCSMAQASQHQWRAYGWNGTAFTQTGGPTAFGPNPKVTNLVATPAPLILVKQSDGSYQGTLRVTMHNAAHFPTPGSLEFMVSTDPSWLLQPAAGSGCQFRPDEDPRSCLLPALAAGADRMIDVHVTVPAGASHGPGAVYLNSVDANHGVYPDGKDNAGTNLQVTWS